MATKHPSAWKLMTHRPILMSILRQRQHQLMRTSRTFQVYHKQSTCASRLDYMEYQRSDTEIMRNMGAISEALSVSSAPPNEIRWDCRVLLSDSYESSVSDIPAILSPGMRH